MEKLSYSELLYLLKQLCFDFNPSKVSFTDDCKILDDDAAINLRLIKDISSELVSRIQLPF